MEYTPIIHEALFPPPPPPARGQLASRSGDLTGPADGGTSKDLEREAFNAELDRVAAALEKVSHTHVLCRSMLIVLYCGCICGIVAVHDTIL